MYVDTDFKAEIRLILAPTTLITYEMDQRIFDRVGPW
jgi:hypothetical protein